MDKTPVCPRWFAAMAAVVVLCAACVMAWCGVSSYQLRAQRDELVRSLETSRGRERKQNYEYDQVSAALPETEAQLAAIQPLADAAAATVTDLKAQRRALRERIQAGEAALREARTATAAVLQRLDALSVRVAAVLQSLETQQQSHSQEE